MSTVTQEQYYAKIPKVVVYHPELSGNDVRVYATLSERAGTRRRSWPGIRRIARDLNLSPTTVQSAVEKLEDLKIIEVERAGGRANHYYLPLLATVPDSDTPPYQELEHTVSDSGTELEPRTKTKRTTSSDDAAFADFHAKRAVEAVDKRRRNGLKVKSRVGLAKTIAKDTDFIEESKRIWEHRDCARCKGKGEIEEYSPGAGMTAVKCNA